MSAQKTEAPAVGAARCFGEIKKADTKDSAESSAKCKQLRTVQAELALQGYQLHRVDRGLLLIDRIGHARSLRSVDQARDFLEEMGGAR